jgi:hypothetical protein
VPAPKIVSACHCIAYYIDTRHTAGLERIGARYGMWTCSCGVSESGYRYHQTADLINEYAAHVIEQAEVVKPEYADMVNWLAETEGMTNG